MSDKTILFDEEVYEKTKQGAALLARAVGTSLGPRGNNVGIDLGYATLIVHDGVTIAKYVRSDDKAVDFGIRVIREAANKQVQTVGDGTTAVTVLAEAILREALTAIQTGTNAMSLRRGLEEARDKLIKELDKAAIPVDTLEKKIQVATVSAEDPELGKQIGTLIDKLGLDGVITVEESKLPETFIEQQEGMQFASGWASPYFVTNPQRMEATVEDTFILITDKNVTNVSELLPLFNTQMANQPHNIVIIAPDITDSALGAFIVNKMNGALNVSCVKAPYQAQEQKDFLQDLAVLTGGQVISQDAGARFESITLEQLGRAKRVTSTTDATMIVGGMGTPESIEERITSIKSLQERDEGSDYQREKLKERIAKLDQGIAVIKVGGATEIEIKERVERAKDAKEATLAAVAEGIVAGGEVIYLTIRKVLGDTLPERIMFNALLRPFDLLLENAGLESSPYVFNGLKPNQGVDVTNGEIKDFVKQGIVDPVLVAKEAIKNAVSVAIQVMQTKALIPQPEEKEKK